LKIGEVEAKKAARSKSAPVYPAAAKQLKITGKVVVEAIVDDAGTVGEVRPLTGNAMLTKSAVDAVRRWKFNPFQEGGKAASAVVTLSFDFNAD
jgi:protein TonB